MSKCPFNESDRNMIMNQIDEARRTEASQMIQMDATGQMIVNAMKHMVFDYYIKQRINDLWKAIDAINGRISKLESLCHGTGEESKVENES